MDDILIDDHLKPQPNRVKAIRLSITERLMLPNGMVVKTDDLQDILEHADIRASLLTQVVTTPMTGELLLKIMHELEYKPGYQDAE